MEDVNLLVSDCIVVTCCCQCLILQVIVFVFLQVPHKLVRKTREYAKKKLNKRKRKKTMLKKGRIRPHEEEFMAFLEDEFDIETLGDGCGCLEEVDMVLEELSHKGEFAFGSFWRRDEKGSLSTTTSVAEHDLNDYSFRHSSSIFIVKL